MQLLHVVQEDFILNTHQNGFSERNTSFPNSGKACICLANCHTVHEIIMVRLHMFYVIYWIHSISFECQVTRFIFE